MKIKFKKIVFLQTIVFKKQSYKKTIADLFYKKRSFLKRLFFFQKRNEIVFQNDWKTKQKTILERSFTKTINDPTFKANSNPLFAKLKVT